MSEKNKKSQFNPTELSPQEKLTHPELLFKGIASSLEGNESDSYWLTNITFTPGQNEKDGTITATIHVDPSLPFVREKEEPGSLQIEYIDGLPIHAIERKSLAGFMTTTETRWSYTPDRTIKSASSEFTALPDDEPIRFTTTIFHEPEQTLAVTILKLQGKHFITARRYPEEIQLNGLVLEKRTGRYDWNNIYFPIWGAELQLTDNNIPLENMYGRYYALADFANTSRGFQINPETLEAMSVAISEVKANAVPFDILDSETQLPKGITLSPEYKIEQDGTVVSPKRREVKLYATHIGLENNRQRPSTITIWYSDGENPRLDHIELKYQDDNHTLAHTYTLLYSNDGNLQMIREANQTEVRTMTLNDMLPVNDELESIDDDPINTDLEDTGDKPTSTNIVLYPGDGTPTVVYLKPTDYNPFHRTHFFIEHDGYMYYVVFNNTPVILDDDTATTQTTVHRAVRLSKDAKSIIQINSTELAVKFASKGKDLRASLADGTDPYWDGMFDDGVISLDGQPFTIKFAKPFFGPISFTPGKQD